MSSALRTTVLQAFAGMRRCLPQAPLLLNFQQATVRKSCLLPPPASRLGTLHLQRMEVFDAPKNPLLLRFSGETACVSSCFRWNFLACLAFAERRASPPRRDARRRATPKGPRIQTALRKFENGATARLQAGHDVLAGALIERNHAVSVRMPPGSRRTWGFPKL